MLGIRTVNIAWERKIRGTYPVARYALSDDATLLLAIPHPLERRAYDLTRLDIAGGVEVRSSFTVETLLKLEVAENAEDFIGLTSGDLYLFRSGAKTRFMGDRRMVCTDAGVSADGRWVTAGFSDMAGNSYALAFGDIAGRVVWTRDIASPLIAVVLSRDGGRIVYATEDGLLWLVDASRRDIWVFEVSEAATAIACSSEGTSVVYGTATGSVGWIDAEGKRRWETTLPGAVLALVVSGDGTLCAALVRPEGEPGANQVCLLTGAGHLEWEYPLDRPATGLALSPNGRFFATGSRDGTLSLYEIIPGESGSVAAPATYENMVSEQDRMRYADVAGHMAELTARLADHPADMALFENLATLKARLRSDLLASVGEQLARKEFVQAIEEIHAALAVDPEFLEALEALTEARNGCVQALLQSATEAEQREEFDSAEAALLEAIRIDPDSKASRVHLVSHRSRRAAALDAEVALLVQRGDLEATLNALEKAQSLAPSVARGASLQQTQTALEFALGMTAYEEKRYREAVFQFKKVLNRDPVHAEARRHLGYAQKFAQDAALDAVNDRFSKLE